MFNSILKMATKPKETDETTEKEVSNRERFTDAATRRVQKAVLVIESMQQFTSSNYEYTKEDVEVIASTLNKEIETLKGVLLNPKTKKQLVLFK